MNADALAAVMAAAAHVLTPEPAAPKADGAARWNLATRMRATDAPAARLMARARSRWSMSNRLDD